MDRLEGHSSLRDFRTCAAMFSEGILLHFDQACAVAGSQLFTSQFEILYLLVTDLEEPEVHLD